MVANPGVAAAALPCNMFTSESHEKKKTNLLIAENTKRKNQEQFKHSMLTLENSFTSSGVECNGAGLSGCGVRDIEALEWDFLTRGED